MPSLRQKVTTYFRQLSFIADPREGNSSASGSRSGLLNSRKSNDDDGNFIIKYLENRTERSYIDPGPDIISGHEPHEMPDLLISPYPTGISTISAACTGPDDGLTGIKRSKLHLSAGSDIDFIDTIQEQDIEIRKSISNHNKFKFNYSNSQKNRTQTTTTTDGNNSIVNDQNANKTPRSRKNSRSSVSGNILATGTNSMQTTTVSTILNSNKIDDKKENKEENQNTGTGFESGSILNTTDNKLNKDGINNIKQQPTTIYVSMISTSNRNSPKTPQKTLQQQHQQQQQSHLLKSNNSINVINNSILKTDGINNATTTQQQQQQQILLGQENLMTTTLSTTTTTTTTILNNSVIDILQQKSNNAILEKENEISNTNILDIKRNNLSSSAEEKENWNNHILGGRTTESDTIAGVSNWKMETEHAFGISVSLYEHNLLTKEPMGSPIADCYGMVVRGNACAMAMADGVNWGDGARLAARSAVHGSLDYLDTAIFAFSQECAATSTKDVFISLFRALWEGHDCILEVGGALSTLTVAVILPLSGDQYNEKYVVCACNVGDSLGYIYSKKYGVREFTQGSHDITSMRDMRDALGALGPVDGNKPELSNLTLSMTIVETGDIVFLTSDGISDNFDPVVGKFAEAWSTETKLRSFDLQNRQKLAPKRQNRSAGAVYTTNSASVHNKSNEKLSTTTIQEQQQSLQQQNSNIKTINPNIPVRPQRTKQKSSSPSSSSSSNVVITSNNLIDKSMSLSNVPSRPKYMRSHTVIEPRIIKTSSSSNNHHHSRIPRSAAGLPLVTGPQRHALTLLRLEDLLSYGINGQLCPCPSARRLCHLLVDFVRMITSARRKTLEQRELFYKLVTGPDGIKREIEMTRIQHRSSRKRIVDSSAFSSLPGKLDHASVVAYTVGSGLQAKEFKETNF